MSASTENVKGPYDNGEVIAYYGPAQGGYDNGYGQQEVQGRVSYSVVKDPRTSRPPADQYSDGQQTNQHGGYQGQQRAR